MGDTTFNGEQYDFGTIDADASGVPLKWIKSVSYSVAADGADHVYGAGKKPRATTPGKFKPTASLEVFKKFHADFIAFMGNGWMLKKMDWRFSYGNNGQAVVTDIVKQAKITKADQSHSQGGDALTVKYDLLPMDVIENGISAMPTET